MDKSIALAVNFNKAPKELQAAAHACEQLDQQIEKAKRQLLKIQDEIGDLESRQAVAEREFRSQMKLWDPMVDKASVVK